MSKKFVVLMGSPNLNGNTAELCKPFIAELNDNGMEVNYITLSDKNILPCKGCYACQNVSGEYGCIQEDDVDSIVEKIIEADCIVFATPIFSWYCPTNMKSLLDRHYGMNKYYGSATGSLWEGKKVAIIATHGYEAEYACEPFETGIKRLCIHSKLDYLGMYSIRDVHGIVSCQTEEAINGAREFARKLVSNIN